MNKAEKTPFIEANHLSFSYPDEHSPIPALSDVSLTVYPGEYVAILGHNGSGKSTFAKLLNHILTPTGGSLRVAGFDLCSKSFSDDDLFALRQKIGMVFENPDKQLVAGVVEEDEAIGPEKLGRHYEA
ncbi:MAG: ATP-binding cassette domain-containing protein, partial [Clostridia bacterium]|nr:ATP-binding cassette domain-containing protein [Clostridia bacterium]